MTRKIAHLKSSRYWRMPTQAIRPSVQTTRPRLDTRPRNNGLYAYVNPPITLKPRAVIVETSRSAMQCATQAVPIDAVRLTNDFWQLRRERNRVM